MTNYLRMMIAAAALGVVTLGPAACSAAENPAPARPGAPPAAQPAPAALGDAPQVGAVEVEPVRGDTGI